MGPTATNGRRHKTFDAPSVFGHPARNRRNWRQIQVKLKNKMRTFIAIIFAAVLTSQALAQEQVVLASTEPKTQLEAFATRAGTVMVKGFTTMGTVRGQKNTFVEVVCKEFVDTSSGQKAYGITVTVTDAGGDPESRAHFMLTMMSWSRSSRAWSIA